MNKPTEKIASFRAGDSISKTELDRVVNAIAKRIVGGLGINIRTINNQIIVEK